MVTIAQGQAVALFAFDVGYEVSLQEVSSLLSSSPVQPLSRKRQTPSYLQYTDPPPQVLNLGETPAIGAEGPGQLQATVFSFGAISLAFRWPLRLELDQLPQLSQRLYGLELEKQARSQVSSLMEKLRPAIARPQLSNLVEDYYLYILEELDSPLKAEDLLAHHRATLAQVLRFETLPLSFEQQEEALCQAISYYENDLVLVDWNASIIYDRDHYDTVNVLELINVELLEARYIDAQLDRQVGSYEGLVQKRFVWPIPLRTPYRQAIEELAELRLEYSLLSERVDNALKLIGDLYLAKVHAAATKRFYLREWEAAIAQKLDIVANLYQLLTDRLGSIQGQTLELVVIALIFFEVVMAFVRGG
ncbi:hypothetical protein [Gloeobacter morelensis]|uniref:DUF155 domain-containing protein n=1 Tax=Gloeobacter morelensis MG652769 TaxID=2781736 RepID=A0ABY3PQ77_9CYAN|nr:hypothetical protein [Gloeobacter morelensis]UFP95799.1 hypothetical protein ISF26_06085 [Gloeobacter morelensis MG652769]